MKTIIVDIKEIEIQADIEQINIILEDIEINIKSLLFEKGKLLKFLMNDYINKVNTSEHSETSEPSEPIEIKNYKETSKKEINEIHSKDMKRRFLRNYKNKINYYEKNNAGY